MVQRRHHLLPALIGVLLVALAAPALRADQAPAQDQRSRLGVGPVEILGSLHDQMEREGKAMMISRVAEALEPQLIDRLHNTRKFVMVTRSDLRDLLDERGAELPEPTGELEDAEQADRVRVPGLDYLAVVVIDHFEDRVERQRFEGRDLDAVRRTVEIGAVAKLWNTETGELLESANFELSSNDPDLDLPRELRTGLRRTGTEGEGEQLNRLLRRMSHEMAHRIANRVVDATYPATVMTVRASGGQRLVFINRGSGTDINVGETWTVYSVGEELIDPATGMSLGQEELPVGRVRINAVRDLFSTGELIDDDLGISAGDILRRDDADTTGD